MGNNHTVSYPLPDSRRISGDITKGIIYLAATLSCLAIGMFTGYDMGTKDGVFEGMQSQVMWEKAAIERGFAKRDNGFFTWRTEQEYLKTTEAPPACCPIPSLNIEIPIPERTDATADQNTSD